MTKIVQVAGGPRDSQDQYTGPARELTVDESNWDIRVHDGSTPGGRLIINQDNADNRYQLKSSELNGLTGFLPEQRGFLARLGPSDYRLRVIGVNTQQLSLTNGDGYAGNPVIGLASVISTDHQWDGQHIYNDVVQFNAGINADVAGDTTGTHTGPVVGDVTGNVTGNTTGTHTGPHVGNVDVTGATLSLDDNQIPLAKIAGLLNYIKVNALPLGMIMMWSGDTTNIPAGWYLCDGLNGTPDLRNRFIRGAGAGGSFSTPGAVGGQDTVTPLVNVAASGAHTHTLSGTTGSATTGITVSLSTRSQDWDPGGGATQVDAANVNDPGHTHATAGTADSAGSHTHSASASAHTNMPAFYALCYVMKGI